MADRQRPVYRQIPLHMLKGEYGTAKAEADRGHIIEITKFGRPYMYLVSRETIQTVLADGDQGEFGDTT